MVETGFRRGKFAAYLFAVALVFSALASSFSCFANDSKADGIPYKNFTYELDGTTAVITSVVGSVSGRIVLPSEFGFFHVGAIGREAFKNCTEITEVVFPERIAEIRDGAFSGCSSLEKVSFSKELFSIGKNAFSDSALKSVKIPESVSFIGENAFKNCPLSGVIMTAMPETIEDLAFQNCGEGEARPVFFGFDETSVKAFAEENGFLFKNIACRHGAEKFSLVPEIKPTCTEDGREIGVFCGECNLLVGGAEPIEKSGHNVVETESRDSTCTVQGSFGGKHCSACGEVIESPQSLPLIPHEVESAVTKKATAKENGVQVERCSVCKKILKKTAIKKVSNVYLSKTVFTFENRVFTPGVTVKDSDGKKLKEKRDYTVTYSPGRKKTGRYPVTVSLIGNYSGKITLSFSIVPGKTSALKTAVNENNVVASWKKVAGADGYRVYLFREKDFLKSIDTTKTNVTFKNLSKGAKFKITVRAFKKSGKEKLFSTFSESAAFLTKPAAVKINFAKAKGQSATLSWNGQKFVTGYVVYVSSRPDKGFKKIGTVKGKNVFTVKNLQRGRTYYFKVRSYKKAKGMKAVYSDFGKAVSVKIK